MQKEMGEFARYSKMMEKFIAVLFVFTIILIAVNIPAVLVDIHLLSSVEIQALFLCEIILVVVIIYVVKKVLSE